MTNDQWPPSQPNPGNQFPNQGGYQQATNQPQAPGQPGFGEHAGFGGQPQYGQQGFGNAPAGAPPKRSNTTRNILLGVGGLFFFILLVCCIGGFFLVRTVRAPVDTTNEFFAAVQAGDFDQAQRLSSQSPGCEFATPEAIQLAFVNGVSSYNFASSSVDDNTAEVSGTFQTTSGENNFADVELVDEGGWQVCQVDSF